MAGSRLESDQKGGATNRPNVFFLTSVGRSTPSSSFDFRRHQPFPGLYPHVLLLSEMASKRPAETAAPEVPDTLVDPKYSVRYEKGRFLGKVIVSSLLIEFSSFLEVTRRALALSFEP